MARQIKPWLMCRIFQLFGGTRYTAAHGIAALLASFCFVLGLSALIAYLLGLIPFLNLLNGPAVNPMTALCILILAMCVILHGRLGRAVIGLTCAAMLILLSVRLLLPDIPIDSKLRHDQLTLLLGTSRPRGSTNTSLCLALLCLSMLLRHYRNALISQMLAVVSFGIPAVSLLGFLLELPGSHAQMALITVLMLMPLSMAVALCTAHRGVLRVLLRPDRIGALTGRYVALALLAPYFLGIPIILFGQNTANLSFAALIVASSQTVAIVVALLALSFGQLERRSALLRHRAERQAQRDSLTGALNRAQFTSLASRVTTDRRQQKSRVSLLFVDIDHFKAINDRYGHAAGDQVLKRFIRLARQGLRHGDTVGRWGGEEFVVLLPATDQASALRIAEKIRRRIESERFDYISPGLTMTISIGCSEMIDGEGIDQLVERADAALYTAKRGGRNQTAAA